MVTPEVTGVWEFYRDNCPGFKEPMRKQLRRLDEYVAALEDENDRLRELVRDMHLWFVMGHDWGPYCAGEKASVEDRMRELGVDE